MPKILLATNNEGKLNNLRAMLEGLPVQVLGPADLGIDLEVPEEGATYAANAREKALAFAAASGLPSLADDSGLEISALSGWPGLHSVRFAGPNVDLSRRKAIILDRLRGVADRSARFVCVVVLAEPGRVLAEAEGVLEGTILDVEQGSGGFGYDPIFRPQGMTRTLAEISEAEKARFTHRARAVQAIFPSLIARLGLNSKE